MICCSKASSQTMLTIAADPKRLGVKIGITSRAAQLGLGHDSITRTST